MFEAILMGVGFWLPVFLFIIFVAAITTSEVDNFWGGALVLIIGIFGTDYLFDVPILSAIYNNPIIFILLAIAYILTGFAYAAIWKWPDYLRNKSDEIEKNYRSYEIKNTGTSFDEYMNSYEFSKYTASDNKERIANWVMMWPFSFFWEVTRKPAIWLFNTVYTSIGTTLEEVGKNVVKKNHEKKNK